MIHAAACLRFSYRGGVAYSAARAKPVELAPLELDQIAVVAAGVHNCATCAIRPRDDNKLGI